MADDKLVIVDAEVEKAIRDMTRVSAALCGTAGMGDEVQEAVGHNGLANALRLLADNWSVNRTKLLGEVDTLAGHLRNTKDQFDEDERKMREFFERQQHDACPTPPGAVQGGDGAGDSGVQAPSQNYGRPANEVTGTPFDTRLDQVPPYATAVPGAAFGSGGSAQGSDAPFLPTGAPRNVTSPAFAELLDRIRVLVGQLPPESKQILGALGLALMAGATGWMAGSGSATGTSSATSTTARVGSPTTAGLPGTALGPGGLGSPAVVDGSARVDAHSLGVLDMNTEDVPSWAESSPTTESPVAADFALGTPGPGAAPAAIFEPVPGSGGAESAATAPAGSSGQTPGVSQLAGQAASATEAEVEQRSSSTTPTRGGMMPMGMGGGGSSSGASADEEKLRAARAMLQQLRTRGPAE